MPLTLLTYFLITEQEVTTGALIFTLASIVLRAMKAATLNDRVTDTVVEAEAWTLGDILSTVKDKALVDTLAGMLTETEAAILFQTPVDVEARHWFKT